MIRDLNEGTECPFLRKRVPSQRSSRAGTKILRWGEVWLVQR